MDPKTIITEDTTLILRAASATALTATTNIPASSTVGGAGDLEFGQPTANSFHFAPGQGGVPMLCNINIASFDFTTTDETYAFKMQTSPDGSTWTDASRTASVGSGGTDNIGTAAAMATAGGPVVLGFFATGRYVRLVATLGGTTPILTLNDVFIQPRVNAM